MEPPACQVVLPEPSPVAPTASHVRHHAQLVLVTKPPAKPALAATISTERHVPRLAPPTRTPMAPAATHVRHPALPALARVPLALRASQDSFCTAMFATAPVQLAHIPVDQIRV